MARRVVAPVMACLLASAIICLISMRAAPVPSRVDALGDPLPEGAIARLGTTRMHHSSTPDHHVWGIGSIAWSPDGKTIATTSYSGEIGVEARLWDASTGKPLIPLENNLLYGPSLVSFAPDGKTIAAAARDKIVLWDPATGQELAQLVGQQSDVDSFVFQDGGKTIVLVSRDGVVRWWNVAGRKVIRQWQLLAGDPKETPEGKPILQRGVRHACFSSDGNFLALNKWWNTRPDGHYSDNLAIVFDLSAEKELWRKDIQVYDCQFAFSPDANRLVLSWAASFGLWETATGRRLSNLQNLLAWTMDFSPNGKTLAACASGQIAFWSPDEAMFLREIESPLAGGGYNTFAARPAFSPDGTKLAIDRRKTFQILDVSTGKPILSWPSYDEGFGSLAFSADGSKLFTEDFSIDTATWQPQAPEKPLWKQFDDLKAVSSDRALCVAADGEGENALYNIKTGEVLAPLKMPRRDVGHRAFFSPKATLYVNQDHACDGKELDTVFAIPSGERLWQLSLTHGTGDWSFSADESRVAFADRGRNVVAPIRVHDTATGKLLGQFGKPDSYPYELAPNGNLLAFWDPQLRQVHICYLRTGKTLQALVLNHAAKANCLLWSADNRLLVVAYLDGSIRLWDVESERVRREFHGHQDQISSLAFSPDGKILASASADTTLLIWKIVSGK